MTCQFLRVGRYAFDVMVPRAGRLWPEGILARQYRGRRVFSGDGGTFGQWPSEEKAKRAISDYIESWE